MEAIDERIASAFQFTASYEADLVRRVALSKGLTFQFTASYEADHDAIPPFVI